MILTAAHCVATGVFEYLYFGRSAFADVEYSPVLILAHSTDADSRAVKLDVKNIYSHPGYLNLLIQSVLLASVL